jgi:hypothetical protein
MNQNKATLSQEAQVQKLLSDPYWRINNLYYIVDKHGKKVKFRLNWAQDELYKNIWYLNIILKARQLGLSTFVGLLFLDRCFFNSNVSAGIIAHTREDAEKLFRRIKFAYDNLPEELRDNRRATIDSARELALDNGSVLRVGTSMRGQTLQYLHISEFGKICAHYPEKAREIITGSLNTLATGQYVFIESTAEGSGGTFYDMCQKAQKAEKEKVKLTQLDYKFFFFPWWKEPSYKLAEFIEPQGQLKEYFKKIDSQNILLSGAQIAWYCKKYEVLEDDILREFPSTPEEAFQGSASGLFYGSVITQARIEKRIGNVPYDQNALVHTAWDLGLGVGGYTAIWFFQIAGNEVHIIDFYQDNGKSLADYIHYIKGKPYTYGEHLAPHDIGVHEYTHGYSRLEIAKNLGINFIITSKPLDAKKPLSVIEGIDAVKTSFPRFWFDQDKCKEGIRMIENYRKEWDERLGRWSDKPVKDIATHAADSLRYLAIGLNKLESHKGSIEDDYKALRAYWG